MRDTTVVMPCYNGARFLHAAITSVLEQTRPVAELVVVDDGSTDESVAVVESYRAAGHPVRSIVVERNGGPATARNIGIASARTPFVAFLDADDRWEPHHCATLVPLLERHRDAALAFARWRVVDQDAPTPSVHVPTDQLAAAEVVCAPMLETMLYDNLVLQSAVVVRRDALLTSGGYTDGLRYSEDYDLWLRMAHGRPFVRSNATTCIRVLHPAQATHQALKMFTGAWEARTRYAAFAQNAGGAIPANRYRTICVEAYERDLVWAWQSRSLTLLRGVLGLSRLVPGGDAVRRRWTRRMLALWPLWRSAAYCWDALPASWRRLRTGGPPSDVG